MHGINNNVKFACLCLTIVRCRSVYIKWIRARETGITLWAKIFLFLQTVAMGITPGSEATC
jgi:hypothetical protein